MKKIAQCLCSAVLLPLLLSMAAPPAAAAGSHVPDKTPVIVSGDYAYKRGDGEGVTIVGYSGSDADVEIPSALDGFTVAEIGEQAFAYCEMETLVIPEGVAVTGRAFEYSVITDALTLPEGASVTSRAFEYASLPATLTIPARAVVEGSSFSYCEQLRALFVEPGACVKGSAFGYSEDLKNIVCASGAKIADKAFYGCERLEEVVLCGEAALEGKPFRDSSLQKTTTAEASDYAPLAAQLRGKADEPPLRAGTVEGGAYRNETLGLSCALSEAWTFAAPEELDVLMGISDGALSRDEQMAAHLRASGDWTDMAAGTKAGEQLRVIVSPIPEKLREILEGLTPVELAAAQRYSAANLLALFGCRDVTFAVDEDYDAAPVRGSVCLAFNASRDDVPVFLREVQFIAEEHLVTLLALSQGEDTTREILACFK